MLTQRQCSLTQVAENSWKPVPEKHCISLMCVDRMGQLQWKEQNITHMNILTSKCKWYIVIYVIIHIACTSKEIISNYATKYWCWEITHNTFDEALWYKTHHIWTDSLGKYIYQLGVYCEEALEITQDLYRIAHVFSIMLNYGVIPDQRGSPTPIVQQEGNQMKYKYSTFTVSWENRCLYFKQFEQTSMVEGRRSPHWNLSVHSTVCYDGNNISFFVCTLLSPLG